MDLLEYCVKSYKMDAIFVFLVGEYRLRPTVASALALYQMFCANDAPARLSVRELLPPRNLRIEISMAPVQQAAQPAADLPPARRLVNPGKHLFDFIVEGILARAGNQLEEVIRQYDPALTPDQNLPGGRMTAGQLAFVEKVWGPLVRSRLVAAGFRRIANIA